MSAPPDAELTIVGPRRDVITHVREVVSYRELISSLIRKELKVRYKQSALGLLWSMIQPLFLLAIYSLVFSVLYRAGGIPRLGIWILSGLLAWQFVATAVSTATIAITSNGPLVGKVRFPRAVLPTATTGAALVHFALQLGVFAAVLVVLRHDVDWAYVWIVPFALLGLVLFVLPVALLLSAANVYARDTEHLLEMVVMGWFWLTPVVYPFGLAERFLDEHGIPTWIVLLNPVTSAVMVLQRAFYGASSQGATRLLPDTGPLWYLRNIGVLTVVSLVMLTVALRVFDRAEADMAEAL